MSVVLEVTRGRHAGREFKLDGHETFMVGRGNKVQFRILGDRFFSRYHFMIEANPPECFLRDLGSTNGTFVNGRRVRQVHLSDGDRIRGGKTELVVHVREEPAEAAASEPAPGPAAVGAPDMGTTFSARAPDRGAGKELHCAICGRIAEETRLGDLEDTRLISYVCEDCHHENRDETHPIPTFEVLDELGRGSLGPVYKARRLNTDKLVALKVVPPRLGVNPRAVKLFLRVMQLSGGLDHPNIVPLVEMGESGGELWIATEYVDGVDAGELTARRGGTLPPAEAVDITCQVLDALHYAHRLNLVHRDVKPTNVLVTGEPGDYDARLGDFALMKNIDEAGLSGITRSGEVRGTVPFMPPEQIIDCRFVKPAGDIYQVGATLYWLLTGEYAHDFEARDKRGEVKDPFLVILEDPVVPVGEREPSVPQALARVVETALARAPEDRFESAGEMKATLRKALGSG